MQRTPTTLQPRLAAQTRSNGPHHERVADPRCAAVASCSIGGWDPSSVITASLPLLLCCAFCVMRATCGAYDARRENKEYGSLVIWSIGHDARFWIWWREFEPRRVMSIFFPSFFFNIFFCIMYVTQTPQTTQTAHKQYRVRATTSWLQRYTRLPPASRAGSNTTSVR